MRTTWGWPQNGTPDSTLQVRSFQGWLIIEKEFNMKLASARAPAPAMRVLHCKTCVRPCSVWIACPYSPAGVYLRLASACNTCHFSPGELYARLASLWNPASIPEVRFQAGYSLHPILHSYTYQVIRTSIKSHIFLKTIGSIFHMHLLSKWGLYEPGLGMEHLSIL